MGYIGNPLDPWGAADASIAYGACFRAFAASGAYDVLAIVHDFPYRSLPSEVETANEVTRQLLDATRGPAGHPAGLRLADLGRADARDEGTARRRGGRRAAPARRRRGVHGDRLAGPLGAATRASGARRSVASRVAGACRRPDDVRPRARSAPEPPATRTTAARPVRARQSRAPRRGGAPDRADDPAPRPRMRPSPRPHPRLSGRAEARRDRARPQVGDRRRPASGLARCCRRGRGRPGAPRAAAAGRGDAHAASSSSR